MASSNERSYHGDESSSYALPNDDPEFIRLREQHYAYVEAMNNEPLHAPLSQPKRILDIGCGINADMTLYLAKRFPSAQVIGVDLSPVDRSRITSPNKPLPPNMTFMQGNINTLTTTDPRLKPGSFDFVFSRLLIAGLTDCAAYIRLVAGLLAPGGWMELQDTNGCHLGRGDDEEASRDVNWLCKYHAGARRYGLDWGSLRDGKAVDVMRGAGVGEVGERVVRLMFAEGRPEMSRHARYVQRYYPSVYASTFERFYPGKENEGLREGMLEGAMRTLGEEGWYMPLLVFWGRKEGEVNGEP